MTITLRTLNKWRGEALKELEYLEGWDSTAERSKDLRQTNDRILRLTQELMDIHYLRKVKT